jgi:predicted ATPase/DNA-binding SARP family transcriptional activator/Tfp pilus assembly protein PilF
VAVEFRILGPLEVLDEADRPLALGGAKQRALLAVLLLHAGAVVSAERLVDELWGEDPPRSARSVLQVYVANLRKVLEPGRARRAAGGILRTRPPGYLVAVGPGDLDVGRFERLAEQGRAALAAGDAAGAAGLLRGALELWRGPALADVALEASGQAEVAGLEERRLAALEERIEAELAAGRHHELVGELEAIIAAHPLRERLHGQLVLALYRSGRQADALAGYRRMRETLAEELGIDPSRPLQALERAILAQDPALDWLLAAARPAAAGQPNPSRRASPLPVAPTPLIGQEQALADVTALIREGSARLVTLTGVGGVGKTRLALQAAAELNSAFANGVWFVALASVADPLLVLPTLAQALGVRETGRQALDEHLRDQLRERQLLLVLDNFEHLLAAAPAVTGLLAGCPNLRVLVTSRAALRVSGEHVYEVPPLAFPDLDGLDAAGSAREDGLLAFDAVALFVARARAVRPDFALTPANAAAVAAVCARLDGLPLALELAAARVRLLSAQDLQARLQRRLELLTAGPRDLPARQQTLRATLDWSYDLLDPVEQQLLARLAVFAGGCTVAAAEAVCSTDGDHGWSVLDGLTGLVANSLAGREDQHGDSLRDAGRAEPAEGSRLRLLETVREYAWERLQASGEADAVSSRHAAHFLALAEQAWPELWGADQERWFARLDREHGNLRTALAWAQARPDPELLAGLAGALGPYWEARGQLSEAYRWLDAALAAEPVLPRAWARVLMAKSRLLLLVEGDAAQALPLLEESLTLYRQQNDARWMVVSISHLASAFRKLGQHPRADALFDESIHLARRHGDAWALSLALNNYGGDVLEERADTAQARPLLEESLALRRTLGEPRGVATTLSNLGALALLDGDPDRAARLFAEHLALAQQAGLVPHTVWALTGLGLVAVYQDDSERAAGLLRQGLRLARDLRDRPTVAECLAGLAAVTADPAVAARLWGAVQHLHADLGISPVSTRLLHRQGLAALRKTLDPESLQAAMANGATTPVDQLIAALDNNPP